MRGIIYKVIQRYLGKFYKITLENHFKRKWLKRKSINLVLEDSRPRILFLPVPILNNKYWAIALRNAGYKAHTLMATHYSITQKEDFDFYFSDIKQNYCKNLLFKISILFGAGEDYLNYKLFQWSLENYDIFCMPFSGGILSATRLKNMEAQFIKNNGGKVLTFAYGGDYFQYSRVLDPSYRHAINASYPEMAKLEYKVYDNYKYWAEHSDFVMGSMAHDGLGRWDMLPVNFITIDTSKWRISKRVNKSNGKDGEVTISHSPNHRYVKGTEFILNAIQKLRDEGLQIKLYLIENKSNQEVKRILENEVDIHIEQIIYTGYALSAIEGMACGLPVISNEENEITTRVLRRYSFLNECPIVSTSPEKVKDTIRKLILNPELRLDLGRAGRKYVEKYHSNLSAQHMFGKILDKVWYGKDVDLMSEFHPLLPGSYNNSLPIVKHPLIENKFPDIYN